MIDNMLEAGSKVVLKTMDITDVTRMGSWSVHQDPLYFDYNFPILTRKEEILWYKAKTEGKDRVYSIFNFDKRQIGYMSLRNLNNLLKRGEFGIVLDPAYINQGYGTDAIKTFMNWYFNQLKYKRLYLTVALYNKRAFKVYKNLGFEYLKIVYEYFDNPVFDPYAPDNIKKYGKYFEKKGGKYFSKCIKMVKYSYP